MEPRKKYRKVELSGPEMHDFLENLDPVELEKVVWTFRLIESVEHIPRVYFKHITACKGLFEIRIRATRRLIRIFCVFGSQERIVLLCGFIKKTDKTPRREIERAMKLKYNYDEKNKGN